jgi:hypothetical protein
LFGGCPTPCPPGQVRGYFGCKKLGSWFGGKRRMTRRVGQRGGSAVPYSPTIWRELGLYPVAVGGRRRKKSKASRKHKKRTHKRNRSHRK